jgi:YesN/AraC family two-component response regulator
VYVFNPQPDDAADRERSCVEEAAELGDRLSEMRLENPDRSVRSFLEKVREEPLSSATVRRLAYTVALGLQKMIIRFAGTISRDRIEQLPDPFLVIQDARHLDDLICGLSAAIGRAVSYVSEAREKEIRDERSALVLSYLDDHYAEPISLDDVAEVAGMHPARFSTWFKATQGVNYIDYLTGLRIETAKKLLRRDNALVKDVALASGFQNARYFGQVFKKIVGITPSRYHFYHVREHL